MILLDAQSDIFGLHFPVYHPMAQAEITKRVDLAVKSQAILTDPLRELQDEDTSSVTFDYVTAINWLVDNTSLDVQLIMTDEDKYNFFAKVLKSNTLKAWTFNVDQLAKQLVARNYSQGWDKGNDHPIFSLRHPHVSAESGSHILEVMPLLSEHWSQFVRAVIARAAKPTTHEATADYVTSIICLLSRAYPLLGERSHGKYSAVSSTPTKAEQLWQENINAAAVKMREALSRRR